VVDIHSHIVYGVDDGAKTVEDSLGMLEIAADSGTTDIVATPHSDLRFQYDPDLIRQRIAEMQAAIGDRIRIHRGCDFHLYFENIRDCMRDSSRYTINGERYLMVEFAEQSIPKAISQVFRDMIQRDITPVITHPERNALLMARIDEMMEWIRSGCLIQITGQSFTGRFGKSAEAACRRLMDRNMVHFVASDAHDTEWRPPDLRDAWRHVCAEYGKSVAERLFETNPRMTLTGDYIECEDPGDLAETRKPWYRFW
jgi:protein-tyrosine phosphatase